jgi:SAM-dependent methyltransferase
MTDDLRTYGIDDPDLYWKNRREDDRIKEYTLHKYLQQIIDSQFPAGGSVLDCGMGAGHVLKLCRERHKVYGIDYSAEAIDIYGHPEDDVRQADLNNGIPDFGLKFDAVVASMLLHWLDDPKKFLENIKQVLSERGIAVIVVPNIVLWKYRIRYLFYGKFPAISLSHKNFQTPREVEGVFEKSGLRISQKLSAKSSVLAKLMPGVFSNDIIYVLKP